MFIFLHYSQDEERLRAIYEKQCKRLKILDDRGAESSKIDATEASIRKLLTKINICIRTVESISGRIHKLRDEELQPQLAALINGYKIASHIIYANIYILCLESSHMFYTLIRNCSRRAFLFLLSCQSVGF